MANLTISTTDNFKTSSCLVKITCTPDVKESILETCRKAWTNEMLTAGINDTSDNCIITFTLICREKIKSLKQAICNATFKQNNNLN